MPRNWPPPDEEIEGPKIIPPAEKGAVLPGLSQKTQRRIAEEIKKYEGGGSQTPAEEQVISINLAQLRNSPIKFFQEEQRDKKQALEEFRKIDPPTERDRKIIAGLEAELKDLAEIITDIQNAEKRKAAAKTVARQVPTINEEPTAPETPVPQPEPEPINLAPNPQEVVAAAEEPVSPETLATPEGTENILDKIKPGTVILFNFKGEQRQIIGMFETMECPGQENGDEYVFRSSLGSNIEKVSSEELKTILGTKGAEIKPEIKSRYLKTPDQEPQQTERTPMSFAEFVAKQKMSPEQRALWTDDQKREAYQAYIFFEFAGNFPEKTTDTNAKGKTDDVPETPEPQPGPEPVTEIADAVVAAPTAQAPLENASEKEPSIASGRTIRREGKFYKVVQAPAGQDRRYRFTRTVNGKITRFWIPEAEVDASLESGEIEVVPMENLEDKNFDWLLNFLKGLLSSKNKDKYEALIARTEALLEKKGVEENKRLPKTAYGALKEELGKAHPDMWLDNIQDYNLEQAQAARRIFDKYGQEFPGNVELAGYKKFLEERLAELSSEPVEAAVAVETSSVAPESAEIKEGPRLVYNFFAFTPEIVDFIEEAAKQAHARGDEETVRLLREDPFNAFSDELKRLRSGPVGMKEATRISELVHMQSELMKNKRFRFADPETQSSPTLETDNPKKKIEDRKAKEEELEREIAKDAAEEEELNRRIAALEAKIARDRQEERTLDEEIARKEAEGATRSDPSSLPENTTAEIEIKIDALEKEAASLQQKSEALRKELNDIGLLKGAWEDVKAIFKRPGARGTTGINEELDALDEIIDKNHEEKLRLYEKKAEVYREEKRVEREREQAEEEEREREQERKRIEEIEKDKKINPFKHFVIDDMSDEAFKIIFAETKENATLERLNLYGTSGRELNLDLSFPDADGRRSNTIRCTSNGFTLQLLNKDEVTDKNGAVMIDDPRARYKLVTPTWTYIRDDLNYTEGVRLMKEEAKKYHDALISEFENQNK